VYVPDDGFYVHLSAYEKNPLTRYHALEDPVWNDSCLQFFVNFAPDKSDQYLTFEMNAGGGVWTGVGSSIKGRSHFTELLASPAYTYEVCDEFWSATLPIPMKLIEAIYGKIDFKPGYAFRGDFHKCGFETDPPHYLSWSKIETEKPDFHQQKFFGDLVIG